MYDGKQVHNLLEKGGIRVIKDGRPVIMSINDAPRNEVRKHLEEQLRRGETLVKNSQKHLDELKKSSMAYQDMNG